MSPREGEACKLGSQASLSYLGVSACLGMVFIGVSLPHRGMACHDATVPTMTTLLARWWFTNYLA
jgi:hypothetical protein